MSIAHVANMLSLDIETSGVRPGCRVLQIGICTLDERQKLKIRIDKDSYIRQEFHDDLGTVDWWHGQPNYIEVWTGQISIEMALVELARFIATYGDKTPIIWTKGAFDLPILQRCYEVYGQIVPWHFRSFRDVRTLLDTPLSVTPPRESLIPHDALGDAIYQARCVVATYQAMVEAITPAAAYHQE